MTSLHWQTIGSGKHDLVMLHGWGLNADVWQSVIPQLTAHFRVHLVDLPGYGRSQAFPPMSLSEMAETLRSRAPRSAIWLGWSLGGLVATKMALEYPDRVSALITVASSPCFIAQQGWPGIKAETLRGFQHQMSEDFQRTVERFVALQAIGSASAKDDIRQLRQVIVDWPVPSLEVLTAGLNMLIKEDLRSQLSKLALPMLRLYGALDGLVPRKIVPLLAPLLAESRSVIIAKAAHAPFISHAREFCHEVISFHKHGVCTDDV